MRFSLVGSTAPARSYHPCPFVYSVVDPAIQLTVGAVSSSVDQMPSDWKLFAASLFAFATSAYMCFGLLGATRTVMRPTLPLVVQLFCPGMVIFCQVAPPSAER